MLEIDFETYSAAGIVWDGQKYTSPPGIAAGSKGLFCTGAWEYAAHDSTEILTVSYSIDGAPVRRWKPGDPQPSDLLNYLRGDGRIEAHNWFFEHAIFNNVATRRHGWPRVGASRFTCTAARAAAYGLPRALEKARTLPADALIFDLEDAVAPQSKTAARTAVLNAISEGGYGHRELVVRINAADTPWHADDLTAVAGSRADAVLLPKVDGPEIVAAAGLYQEYLMIYNLDLQKKHRNRHGWRSRRSATALLEELEKALL